MLKAENLSFSYGKRQVISDISLEAAPGECLVLAGPNGSGKSTLLGLLAGTLKAKSGSISADGKVSFVPQGSALFEDLSVEDNISFFCRLAKRPVPGELPLGLDEWRKQKVSKLSGGTAKRVSIACALVSEPSVLLLDEPCSGLDIVYRDELAELVKELKAQGKTIIYACHEPLEFESFYDNLIFLKDGRGRSFTRAELSGDGSSLEKLIKAYRDLYSEDRR